jgi:hypothetical protein
VKNQYFGDIRDLFKFDLVLEILDKTGLTRFTYIPMLTRDTDSRHVLRTSLEEALAGRKNRPLRTFLEDRLTKGRRSIYETEELFRLPEFSRIHLEMFRPRFQDETRLQYFLSIPKEELTESVVLLDPDEGMWAPEGAKEGERFLRYDELRLLYEEMDPKSVLIFYQHLPSSGRSQAVSGVLQQLKTLVTKGRAPVWISDRQLTFFMLTKDNGREREIESVVSKYVDRYGLKLEDD